MKQILQSARTGKLALHDVPEPRVKAGHVLVRTRASLISAGTERMVVEFAKKNLAAKARARPDLVKKVLDKARRDGIAATMKAVLARLDEPLPLGYSACGDVVAVGAGLEGAFEVGQRVAIAGAGLANHAELSVVPRNLVSPVPEGVADEEACFATLGSIALHGVRCLGAGLGDVVAVIGAGLVGQLASQLLRASGCRPIVLDYNAERLKLARRLGAELVIDLGAGDPTEAILAVTNDLGCDGVLIAAATPSSEPFETAAAIARDRARVSLVGITGTAFPYREFMKKELSVVVSRSYGPGRYDDDFEGRGLKYPPGHVRWTETENLRECVRLMALGGGGLEVKPLISHFFDFERAEEAYALVTGGGEPYLGVVLRYEAEPAAESPARLAPRPAGRSGSGRCVLGVIGAGNFARTMLLPALKRLRNCELRAIASAGGVTADHGRESFGFARAVTDAEDIFADPEIDAVLVATPHSSHAELTVKALEAGKPVYVEKPLALDREQLNRVIAARNRSDAFFLVGFNRRFAPMVRRLRERLAGLPGTRFLLLRVNAGRLPPESWQNAPEEGHGRILGEVCHFVDLAGVLAGSPIASVQASAARVGDGACDDLTVVLRFADGSLATIAYTALGDLAFSKELVEVYAGGSVLTIDNFRRMTTAVDGKVSSQSARAGQDKGHKDGLAAFVDAVAAGGPPPANEAELVVSSLATIAVLESLQTGHRIDL